MPQTTILFAGLPQTRDRWPLRKGGTAEDFFFRVFRSLFTVSDIVLLHKWLNQHRVRHKVNCPKGKRRSPGDNSAAQFVSALLQTAPAKINGIERIIRRCRALQRAKGLRDTVIPQGTFSCPFGQFTLCRACVDPPTCVAVWYLTLRIC